MSLSRSNRLSHVPEAENWKKAIEAELLEHKKNDGWAIVKKPKGRTIIDSKSVFEVQVVQEAKASKS